MPIAQEAASARRIIEAAGALVALVLPPAALSQLTELPPSVERLALIVGTAASTMIVLLVMINGERIRRLREGVLSTILLLSLVSGCAAALVYEDVVSDHLVPVVRIEGSKPKQFLYLTPLTPSKRLSDLTARYSSTGSALASQDGQEITELWLKQDGGTTALIIFLLVLAQALIVVSIVSAAWWLGRTKAPGSGFPTGE